MEKFTELNLGVHVLQAISDMGFEAPSPIQAAALPILLGEPTDFMGLAATGTGKTGAFGIPLVEKMDVSAKGIQALILCPTRELAIQVAGQIDLIGKFKKIRALPIYGGAGYSDQIHSLKKGVSVVVGTPGRVIDHIERGTLKLDQIKTLILDEADEMISMGFQNDLETILTQVPAGQCQTWLFAATMSPEVRKVSEKYLTKPKQVQVNRTEMLSGTVEQVYYATQESNKPEVLCKLIDAASEFYGIVFCQTKALVADLHQYLVQRGYPADCLHGDMDQTSRGRTLRKFRERQTTVLIATDVACRGLDVKDITHVINYSIPRELENYVHRIGRTGRSGKSGFAFSLVTPSHRGLVGRIEQMTKTKMREGVIPTRKELGAKKVAAILTAFQAQSAHERAAELLSEEWKTSIEGMTKEEITSRFLSLLHPEIFAERGQAKEVRASRVVPAGKVVLESTHSAPRSHDRSNDRRDSRPSSRPSPRPYSRPDSRTDSRRDTRLPEPRSAAPRPVATRPVTLPIARTVPAPKGPSAKPYHQTPGAKAVKRDPRRSRPGFTPFPKATGRGFPQARADRPLSRSPR